MAKINVKVNEDTIPRPAKNKIGFLGNPLFPKYIPANVPSIAKPEISKFVIEPFKIVYSSKIF